MINAAASNPFKPKAKGNKFGAKRVVCRAGHDHDSMAEAKRCNELTILQRAGKIRKLEQHPQFWFEINGRAVLHEGGRRVGYKADFGYYEDDQPGGAPAQRVIEDVKGGYRDDAWTLRKAIFRALFPEIELREVKR